MKIEGWVDEHLSPRIEIQTPQGKTMDLVVDTGFNGHLVLPAQLLQEISFDHKGSTVVELADGSKVTSELYEGSIIWFGEDKKVRVHATSSEDALLGTKMLVGYVLELDMKAGKVEIRERQ